MDGCPRQNPAYKSANGKPCKCRAFPFSEEGRASPGHHEYGFGWSSRARERMRERHGCAESVWAALAGCKPFAYDGPASSRSVAEAFFPWPGAVVKLGDFPKRSEREGCRRPRLPTGLSGGTARGQLQVSADYPAWSVGGVVSGVAVALLGRCWSWGGSDAVL